MVVTHILPLSRTLPFVFWFGVDAPMMSNRTFFIPFRRWIWRGDLSLGIHPPLRAHRPLWPRLLRPPLSLPVGKTPCPRLLPILARRAAAAPVAEPLRMKVMKHRQNDVKAWNKRLHCYRLDFSDELSSILKKLSLEKYQPIFEEQEVLIPFFYYTYFVCKGYVVMTKTCLVTLNCCA